MAEAVLDGVSVITHGLCLPGDVTNGVTYFSLGLLVPDSVPSITPGGGADDFASARRRRQKLAEEARADAEFLALMVAVVSALNEED